MLPVYSQYYSSPPNIQDSLLTLQVLAYVVLVEVQAIDIGILDIQGDVLRLLFDVARHIYSVEGLLRTNDFKYDGLIYGDDKMDTVSNFYGKIGWL